MHQIRGLKLDINEKVALEKPKFGQILPMVFSAIGSKPLELLKALLPPTVLLAAFGWLANFTDLLWVKVSFLIFFLPAVTLFSTRTHRAFLLEKEPAWSLRQLWTKRESIFMGYTILSILLLGLVIAIMLQIKSALIAIGLFGLFVYLLSRFSLVFPSVATGNSASLKEAWKISGRHQWYMLWAIGGTAMILNVITKPLNNLVEVPMLIEQLLALVETVILIGALSIAYREIMRFETDACLAANEDDSDRASTSNQ